MTSKQATLFWSSVFCFFFFFFFFFFSFYGTCRIMRARLRAMASLSFPPYPLFFFPFFAVMGDGRYPQQRSISRVRRTILRTRPFSLFSPLLPLFSKFPSRLKLRSGSQNREGSDGSEFDGADTASAMTAEQSPLFFLLLFLFFFSPSFSAGGTLPCRSGRQGLGLHRAPARKWRRQSTSSSPPLFSPLFYLQLQSNVKGEGFFFSSFFFFFPLLVMIVPTLDGCRYWPGDDAARTEACISLSFLLFFFFFPPQADRRERLTAHRSERFRVTRRATANLFFFFFFFFSLRCRRKKRARGAFAFFSSAPPFLSFFYFCRLARGQAAGETLRSSSSRNAPFPLFSFPFLLELVERIGNWREQNLKSPMLFLSLPLA